MRILLTNTGPWGTGSFTVAKAVLKELLELGHEALLFFPDSGIPSPEKEKYYSQKDRYRIWEFPHSWKDFHLESFPLMVPDPHPRSLQGQTYKSLSSALFYSFIEEIQKKVGEVIEDFSPDVIECQHIWLFDLAVSKQKKPFICTAHHSDQMGFCYDERARPLILQGLKKASYVFSVSKYVAKEVEELYSFPQKKIIAIENGYDQDTFYPRQENKKELLHKYNIKVPQEAILVSFSGKVSRTKGIDLLLKANKLIRRPLYFLIMGTGEWEKVISEEEKEEISLDRVFFLGHLPSKEVAKMHNICRFHVMPSRSEGFGLAALEAMGCSLPVIAGRAGGLPEFIVGKLVSEDVLELVKALEEMCDMEETAFQELRKQAREKAIQFSWNKQTEKRLFYYRTILEESLKKLPL